MTEVLGFDDERCLDVSAAGGKGASLARMAGLGLPVPPGFAVHASALVAALPDDGAELRGVLAVVEHARAAERAQAIVAGLELPDGLAEAIGGAYAALGDGAEVAVRSSACAEDSEAASFAGQQETYLHVRGTEEVLRRVRDCWGSFFSERALFYRAKKGSLAACSGWSPRTWRASCSRSTRRGDARTGWWSRRSSGWARRWYPGTSPRTTTCSPVTGA